MRTLGRLHSRPITDHDTGNPRRAPQIAADVGQWCNGCSSGVLGAMDRWWSGPTSHSSAQAVITSAGGEGARCIDAEVGR